jgi:hypothetical protein
MIRLPVNYHYSPGSDNINRSQHSLLEHPMVRKVFRRIALLLCLIALFTAISENHVSAAPRTGSWNYDQYYDSAAQVWVARVTSTVNQVMDCTITWSGLANGQSTGGHNGMRLPAYPGFGAAIVGHLAFNVGNFSGNATCN